MTIVMKFGGSSVADASCMGEVAELVRRALPRGPLVVLSAAGKSTDALFAMSKLAQTGDLVGALEAHRELISQHRSIALGLFQQAVPTELDTDVMRGLCPDIPWEAKGGRSEHSEQAVPPLMAEITELSGELELLLRGIALLHELSPRSLDAVVSVGERLSTRILAAFLGAQWFDARAVMRTDASFGSARPLPVELAALVQERLAPKLGAGRAVITQGYIGATADGLTTTLGRGGSDFSASLFGSVLAAEDIQIWTDVEGVLSCDPRIVPQAQPIAELSFAEAAELAAFGAKVLHPATVLPAVEAGIPVTVRHTRRPEGRFTTIRANVSTGRPVTALATRGPVTVLTVSSARMLNQSGFLAKLFAVFARHGVSVDLIATAEVSVSLTVEGDTPLGALTEELTSFATISAAENRAIVAVVGERLKHTPGITGRCFGALRDINIEMISMGANEINLSMVIRSEDVVTALGRLHGALIEGGDR